MDVVGLKIITPTITDLVVDPATAAWTSAIGNITCSADATIQKVGGSTSKMLCNSGFTPGSAQLLAYHNIGSVNLSTYLAIQLYIFTSRPFSAGQLQLLLSANANAASPLEVLNFPDLVPPRPFFFNMFMMNLVVPASDTAIISLGLQLAPGVALATNDGIWLNYIVANHGYSFNTLGIRGLGDVDDVRLHPGLKQVLLDGSIQTINSAFGRKISCTLWPVGTTKAMRTWMVTNYILSNGLHVVAQGEDVPVVLSNPSSLSSRFIGGTDLARGYDMAFDEQLTRNTTPDAWL